MIAQQNVSYLYVVANAALVVTNAPSTARYLGVKKAGETLCAAGALSAGDRFQILYMNQAGKVVSSPMFEYNVTSKNKFTPISAVSQVSSIGYNGTSGDIVETNSGKYLVTIGFKDTLKLVGNKRLYKYGEYAAGTSAKKYNVAIGLADSLYANLKKDAFFRVVPAAICSSPVTAANGTKTGQEVTVVQYSKYLTFETDVTYTAGGGSTLVVGDYVRLGSVGGGTALTSPVYRVISINSLVVELDRPVTNASGTYDDVGGTSDIEVIPKATAEASGVKWGITLTGNDSAAPFEVGMYGNNVILFTVGVSTDFSTTEVRLDTTPVKGLGTYKDIAQLDWELQNNRREAYRIAEHLVPFTSNAISTDSYHAVYVVSLRDETTNSIDGKVGSPTTIMIAINSTGAEANLDTVFGF